MEELRSTPIQRVLYRENLLMGGERELVMMLAFVAGGIVLTSQNLVAVFMGVPLYVLGMFMLQRMAKVDPYLSKIYLRQLTYRPYYPARSTPFIGT